MITYQVSRLSIAIDEGNGCIQSIRRRPSGFALPLFEPEMLPHTDELPPTIEVYDVVDSMKLPFGSLNQTELLEIRTTWSDDQLYDFTRIFRTLRQALVQKIELFDFHYRVHLRAKPLVIPLLRFRKTLAYLPTDSGFQVRAYPYDCHVHLEVSGQAQCSLEAVADSDDFLLLLHAESNCEVKVSLGVLSLEMREHDPAIYLVPAPLDTFSYISTALAPAVRIGGPLSWEPRLPLVRPCPALFYASSLSALQTLYPRSWLQKFLALVLRRDSHPIALPPADYPLGKLIRMSEVLIYYWRADIADPLIPLADYLRHLPVGNRSSLQLMLVLSENQASTEYFDQLTRTIGPLRLSRAEPSTPEECLIHHKIIANDPANLLSGSATIDLELDYLRWEPPYENRAALRQAYAVRPLSPVPIPFEDSVLAAPFLTAARLRGGSATVGKPDSQSGAWPLELHSKRLEPLSVEVAQFLLTDIMTHEALKNEEMHKEEYEAMWRTQLHRLQQGETQANRVVIVTVSGETPATDRMKLLPAILYSSEVPSPVLPLYINLKQQRRLHKLFSDYLNAAYEACLSAARLDGKSPGKKFYSRLEQKRQAFQDEFRRLLPKEYYEFLRLVKPKEVVNFSTLPLEWLEIDDIPLGYLSKVTAIHSMRLSTDIGYCADLATAYNSLVVSDLRPSRSMFRALIIAPEYAGSDQSDVNRYIEKSTKLIKGFLEEEQSKGRDITLEIAHVGSADHAEKVMQEDWSLVVYIGHAEKGVLSLPDGSKLSPAHLPDRTFLDTTVLLIGCDTLGAVNLTGSIANQFLSLGARGVFSTYFPIPLGTAENVILNLTVYLLGANYQYGDALALARISALWEYIMLFIGQESGIAIPPGIVQIPIAEGKYEEQFRDSWDKTYLRALEEYQPALNLPTLKQSITPEQYSSMIVRRGALAGLVLAFTGDLRARMFEF